MKGVLKKIAKSLIREFVNIIERVKLERSKRGEIRKFEDARRVAIYSQVDLTKEQMQAMDDLYTENYGKKIPHTWHRHFTAFTGRFDEKYFPELLFIPVFERFMNCKKEYSKVIGDKNILPLLAKGVGIQMPKTIVSCAAGFYRDSEYEILSRHEMGELLANIGEVFVKPTVDTCSGVGCKVCDFKDGIDTISGSTVEAILEELGEDFVVQEKVQCHSSISRLYAGSVNTFRIVTYRWKDDSDNSTIFHMPIVMRIGQGGSCLDNAHAGGMFIAIDDDGTLHEKAFTEFKEEYEMHPDTGVKFADYKIELLPEVLRTAKKCHASIPQVGVVNWDFTIDVNGNPVLIEANLVGGGIWLTEMAHGKGCFGEHTEEVLRWIAKVEKLKFSEREPYSYGKMM